MIGILLSRALCTDIEYDETKQLLTINADIAYTRKEIDAVSYTHLTLPTM